MSYFDAYFNLRRERSLRTFSRPVNLARFDHRHWMTTDQPLWFIAEYLFTIHHYRLITPAMVRNLHRLDKDRKSTRLNSSHSQISYAVFCLKKKQTPNQAPSACRTCPCRSPTATYTAPR